jgi:hypothetical protein
LSLSPSKCSSRRVGAERRERRRNFRGRESTRKLRTFAARCGPRRAFLFRP